MDVRVKSDQVDCIVMIVTGQDMSYGCETGESDCIVFICIYMCVCVFNV